ncbi:unnamed protein product [marine sediment metagenome]|uniref:Uncharacterized protein n=1 Tax=marine sediment metagenome TaxID=412755 RepID=X0SQJ4_9ZZZZ
MQHSSCSADLWLKSATEGKEHARGRHPVEMNEAAPTFFVFDLPTQNPVQNSSELFKPVHTNLMPNNV